MNFLEAVQAMKEGKMVRRKGSNQIIKFDSKGWIVCAIHDDRGIKLNCGALQATNWEIFGSC